MKFQIIFRMTMLATCLPLVLNAATSEPVAYPPTADEIQKLPTSLREFCQESYVGVSQEKLQDPCYFGALSLLASDFTKSAGACKTKLSSSIRTEMACLIGAAIAREVSEQSNQSSTPRLLLAEKMNLCHQHFPRHTELDNYMQQSCFFGVYLAHDNKGFPISKPRFELCGQFSNEKSFIGPCATGQALALKTFEGTLLTATALNQLCTNRFDHRAFHQGYRACLNSHGLSIKPPIQNPRALARECASIATTRHDESEQAACVIGRSLARTLTTQKDTRRSRHCTDGQPIRWSDRESLVCMTAASLLDFGDPASARSACKEIFTGRRNSRRNHCLNEVNRIAAQPILAPIPLSPSVIAALQTTSTSAGVSPPGNAALIKPSQKPESKAPTIAAPSPSQPSPGQPLANVKSELPKVPIEPETIAAEGSDDAPPTPRENELWPEAPDTPVESLSASATAGSPGAADDAASSEGRVPNSEDSEDSEDDDDNEDGDIDVGP